MEALLNSLDFVMCYQNSIAKIKLPLGYRGIHKTGDQFIQRTFYSDIISVTSKEEVKN